MGLSPDPKPPDHRRQQGLGSRRVLVGTPPGPNHAVEMVPLDACANCERAAIARIIDERGPPWTGAWLAENCIGC